MLILTRRIGESIVIDNPSGTIDSAAGPITVLRVKGNQVRIGMQPRQHHDSQGRAGTGPTVGI